MSDSNSIKPLGLATALAAGAAVGALTPSVKTKIANYVASSPKVDAFVTSAAKKVRGAKDSVKGAAKTVAEKTKLDKAAGFVSEQFTKLKGTEMFKKIANSGFGKFVKSAAENVGKFLKKPVVIGALAGAFIYTVYKMVKQHQENKAVRVITEELY